MFGLIVVAVLIAVGAVALWRERRSAEHQGGRISRSGLSELRIGEDQASIALGEPGGKPGRDLPGEPAPVEAGDEAFRAERARRESQGR